MGDLAKEVESMRGEEVEDEAVMEAPGNCRFAWSYVSQEPPSCWGSEAELRRRRGQQLQQQNQLHLCDRFWDGVSGIS